MRKIILIIIAFLISIVFVSTASAYTIPFTSLLSDGPGSASLFVGIWSPTDVSNPFFGDNYWYYDYEITNIDYDSYLSVFDIGNPYSVPVEYISTPSGWFPFLQPNSFGWATGTGLYAGNTATGFTVRSLLQPGIVAADAWRFLYPPALGITLGPTIPEPITLSLFGFGLLGVLGLRKKIV